MSTPETANEAAEMRLRRCPTCRTGRKSVTCRKCGNATVLAAYGWEEPKLPPVERIRELAREVGYAIGEHGSQERDLDLIAAPWTEQAVENYALMKHIADGIGAKIVEISRKPLGRFAATIQMDGYFKQIDLSVCPTQAARDAEQVRVMAEALGRLPLMHADGCYLTFPDSNVFGVWVCVPDCQDRIIRQALQAAEKGGGDE